MTPVQIAARALQFICSWPPPCNIVALSLLPLQYKSEFPLYCWDTYVAANNKKIWSVAMERQPCFVFCVVVVVVVVAAAAAVAHPHMPLSTTQSQNVLRSSCEVPDIFVDCHKISILSTNIAKSLQHQSTRIFDKCEPSWYMRNDGATNMTKLTGAFRDFSKAPKG